MPDRRHSTTRRAFVTFAAVIAAASAAVGLPTRAAGAQSVPAQASSSFTLTPTRGATSVGTSGNNQGFSVESADFAHGFLTRELLARPLMTLGERGVLRISGYTVDTIWPAFGGYAEQPAPSWAIGGTVDQSDLDKLKLLADATRWKVTIAVPVASIVNSHVTYDQAVAEVVAAHRTLGDSLLAVEIGNEYNISGAHLTPEQYYSVMKMYYKKINAAIPGDHIKVVGPSDSAAILDTFVSAAEADGEIPDLREEIAAVTAHYYDSGRCGLDIPGLMSADTYTQRQRILHVDAAGVSSLPYDMPVVLNETNSESGSGCTGVSNAYAASLWSLDYLLQAAEAGIAGQYFHTSTARVCGDYRTDPVGYTTSYRWYAAFCASDQTALDANQLSPSPLYYGLWAFRQVPAGKFVEVGGLSTSNLSKLRAYGVVSDDNKLTIVLINVQDPSSSESTTDSVAVDLPGDHATGSAVTLQSSAHGGLASIDASAVTLGGRHAVFSGGPPGAFDHTAVPVDGGVATVDVAPGTAQIITFPDVNLPGASYITGMTAPYGGVLIGAQSNSVTVSVANTADTAQTLTATVQVPAGWQSGSVTQTVPASGRADLSVPVTPPPDPTEATLTAQVSAPQVATYGTASLDVVSTAAAAAPSVAVDGGTRTSPVLAGYTRLSPDDTWTAGDAFGWVGGAPSSRDRGFPDDLRRDFIGSQSPATLRLTIPAGTHETYLLVGDSGYDAQPMTVRSDGQTLASITEPVPAGHYRWVHFPLDGGSAGQNVDLTLSAGRAGTFWLFNALVVLS